MTPTIHTRTYQFDPELSEAAAANPARDLNDLTAARNRPTSAAIESAPPVTVSDQWIPVPGRSDALLVRTYHPKQLSGTAPALLTLHAGGFVLGSIDQDHTRNVALCEELRAVVLAVEYRLAPEHPYPAALDDCWAALRWAHADADALGVDRERLVLLGRSAGGGLAAATALRARDSAGPAVRFLFLAMPQLDDRLTTDSAQQFADTPLWTRQSAEQSWSAYLGSELRGSLQLSAYAAPGRATDLSGLPPAYISAMEFDPLRDEAMNFARALLASGVPTEFHLFPGTFHGSSGLVPTAAISRRETAEQYAVLRRALTTQEDEG